MEIRRMIIDDYNEVYRLWLSCVGMGLNDIDDSKDGIERFLKRNPNTCLVAEENEKIVGLIMVGNDGRRGYIYHTAVSPVKRSKWVGTELVNRALRELKELGIIKVALVVFKKNEMGNSFWEKRGFVKREDLAYRNKTIIEMVRIDT
ncbi:GNAT family N-acetyltransferase [Clostridium sp. LP20]|uniref:GNAT family N-acetyltransferase n=1 Tax=Clostridium sp. LP20 TaxID=3418665 RepID=UPI003EE730C2